MPYVLVDGSTVCGEIRLYTGLFLARGRETSQARQGSLTILGPWFLTRQIDARHRNEVTILIRALGPASNLSLQAFVVSHRQ